MSDEKPYGDKYYAEINRLHEAQKDAAQKYTAQMLYMQHKMFMCNDGLRKQKAEDAAEEWLRLDSEITALNAAEYQKKRGLQQGV